MLSTAANVTVARIYLSSFHGFHILGWLLS